MENSEFEPIKFHFKIDPLPHPFGKLPYWVRPIYQGFTSWIIRKILPDDSVGECSMLCIKHVLRLA